MLDGSLLFSGGVTEQAVSTFVEKFWYWTANEKTRPKHKAWGGLIHLEDATR